MKTLLPLYFLLKNIFAGCYAEIKHTGFDRDREHKIERVANIDSVVKEGSGLAFYKGLFWTVGDSGTPAEVYGLNDNGDCIQTLKNKLWKNYDWEELCVDTLKGRFFIGDFGNNSNRRKDLKVYALDSNQKASTLSFTYKLQDAFPPAKPLRNYDCEAMVYNNDSLFLFSKNRGLPLVKWYGLSTRLEMQEIIPAREIYLKGMITGAAYHEPSGHLVLLAYGKLYWFKVTNGDVLNARPISIKKIPFYGQTEAICFDDKGVLFFTNEKGKMWRVSRK